MILVDSSVWIAAWRAQDSKIVTALTRYVEAGEASINLFIRTELLQGARDRRHQQALRDLLSPIPIHPFSDEMWEEAPNLYLKSRERGITLTTIDCLIATHAQLAHLPLWSLDQTLHKVPGIKIAGC